MKRNSFFGYGVASVTPFLDSGETDFNTLSKLLEFQIGNGADFICALGTTAETPALDGDEYCQILHHILRCVDGRIPVMVGCSDNCTKRLADKLKTTDFTGADAILSCVPSYNKPSQEGIYRHFAEAAAASPLPLFLYNVPGRTGVNMSAETALRLASDFDNIVGIKEASGNIGQIRHIIDNAPSGFTVLCGDDSLAVESIGYGAAGVISVIGNALPRTFGSMIHYAVNGDASKAAEIESVLGPLYHLMFKEGNPAGVKALMASRKMLGNVLRLPLTPVSQETYCQIVDGFENIDL